MSLDLIRNYDIICIEDLDVGGMVKNRRLAKPIQDASWSTFLDILQYKADWNDKRVVKIDRFYPSSRTCGECGYVYGAVRDLSVREWQCPNCGASHNRDINAAKNILKEGLRNINISAGTVDYTDGDDVRHSSECSCQRSQKHRNLQFRCSSQFNGGRGSRKRRHPSPPSLCV